MRRNCVRYSYSDKKIQNYGTTFTTLVSVDFCKQFKIMVQLYCFQNYNILLINCDKFLVLSMLFIKKIRMFPRELFKSNVALKGVVKLLETVHIKRLKAKTSIYQH